MTKRTKKLLSLLLASAMVFTMNTTVFAEEVAVDSVDEAVEASVDAAEEIAADATVDEVAVVDAVTDVNSGKTTESANNYYMYDEKGNISTKIEYNNDGEVSVIRNVLSPVSWNEIVDFGTEEGYGAPELIETVLTGDDYEDSYLSNSKSIKVSDNSPKASVEGLKGGKRTYDVQDLGNGYFL